MRKIVPVEQLISYEWSSLPLFLKRKAPVFLDSSTILAQTETPDTAAGWRRYLEYLGAVADEDEAKRKERYGQYNKGWVIGSAGFRAEIRDELKRQCVDVLKFAYWEVAEKHTGNCVRGFGKIGSRRLQTGLESI